MKYLKQYKTFESIQPNNQYGIGDWIEDLKSFEWGRKNIEYSEILKWSNHFIGIGWCEKIMQRVEKMFLALSKVDEHEINDRMYDVYDKLPSSKDRWVMCAIAYGDVENYNKSTKYKYNGIVSVPTKGDRDKLRILVHIIKEIVFPTMYIGTYPNYFMRQSDQSYFVTEPKWQCQNFNIDNYRELGVFAGAELDTDDYKGRKSHISEYEIKRKREYSIDKIVDMYVPCVVIDIGNRSGVSSGKINLRKLESDLDEVLPTILSQLEYQEVVFDNSRENRLYDDDIDVYDYTVKILLKF